MSLIAKIGEAFSRVGVAVKSILARLTAIEARTSTFGSADVALSLLGGGTQDVTVSFVQPMPTVNYAYRTGIVSLAGLTLGNFQLAVKTKATDKMIFTVKNTGLTLLSGSFTLDVKVQLI